MDKGKVYLVGAGPGDEKLITVRGMELLQEADVIIYDRLANSDLLNYRKESAQLIYVGKSSSHHTVPQDEISERIAAEAEKGNLVVRLKGGDPYVFGRGGEEGELLFDRQIPFEVVPGITSGIGGLAYAGIPITHRDFGSSLHLITGHKKSEKDQLNYKALATLDGTLVFYMGVTNLPNIVEKLLENGKDPQTKVALISWATYPHQKVWITDLQEISKGHLYDSITPPVLTVIGNVVSLRKKLNFYENKPLFGKKIIVTRAGSQASILAGQLKELGARVIQCPSIRIDPINNKILRAEIQKIKEYTHLVFTSQNGVRIFMDEWLKEKDIRELSGLKICSIGEATTKELQKYFVQPDIMPSKYVGEELAKAMEQDIESYQREVNILIPRAKNAREVLVKILQSNNKVHNLKEIHIYETTIETLSDKTRKELIEGADAITFTSSSTVKNFYEMIDESLQEKLKDVPIFSIGPITSATINELGRSIARQASTYTIDGMITVIQDFFNPEREGSV